MALKISIKMWIKPNIEHSESAEDKEFPTTPFVLKSF